MLGQSAYAFSNEPPNSGDDPSAEGVASALELRTELSEFLAQAMHRLESLSEALMHCQTPVATPPTHQPDPMPESRQTPEPAPALPPTETPEQTQISESAQLAPLRPTPEAPLARLAAAPDSVSPPQPTSVVTIEADTTAIPTSVANPNPFAAARFETVQPHSVPTSIAPLPSTIDGVSAAGGDPPASPTPDFSASNPNTAAADGVSDPADRLAAIKLRLAKQIENA